MARYSNVQTDFSGGLVSDYILGRADLKKVGNSARKFKNFFPTLQGPAEYRKGFKRLSAETNAIEHSVSEVITLATGLDYRVVFTSLQIKIYKILDNTLKATVASNYSEGDLPDLRFSPETDGLYITHPNFKPAKLASGLTQAYRALHSNDNRSMHSDEDASGQGTTTPADRPLQTTIEVLGDTTWTLSDIDFEVEPFLPPEDNDTFFTLTEGERYLKIEDTGAFTGVTAGQYVEYQQKGEWFLGEVVDSTEVTSYTILDPTNDVVYIKPVSSVLDINDPDARLYLLDNKETANGSENEKALTIDDVPDGEIHVRSDVLVFRKGFEGAWLRIGDDRRAQEVVVGHQRSNTRWVKLKEHLGSEDHPVDFIRGTDPFLETHYTQGSTYKVFTNLVIGSNTSDEFFSCSPDESGNIKVVNGLILVPDGNRTFTFINGVSETSPHGSGSFTHANGFTTSQTVGNLSTQIQFDVMKCDETADTVEEGTNLVTASSNASITFIANNAVLTASASTFISSEFAVGRHFMAEFPSGNVYLKCIGFTSGLQITTQIINSVPRSARTLEYENGGQLLSLRKGAWYATNYPKTVAKYEQRRVYGGTLNDPNFVFFSRVDSDLDFRPTQDDKSVIDTDGFVYELSNRTAAVNWMLPLKDLVIGTSGGLYRVVPNQYQYGISPKTARIELSEEEPCLVPGVIVGNSIFYPDAAGSRLLEYKYEVNIQSSSSNDITKFIYPTFNKDNIKKVVYQHTPVPKLWCLTTAGKLFCLTYHRQEEFYAWSEQETSGTIHDILVQPRTSDVSADTLFIAVERVINNTAAYHFEVLNDLDKVSSLNSSWIISPHLDSYTAFVRQADGTMTLDLHAAGFPNNSLVDIVLNGASVGRHQVTSATTVTGIDLPAQLNDARTQSIVIGLKYEGELQAMFPTWDGANKPSYGSENMRVVSVKPFLIDAVHYAVGVGNQYDERHVNTPPSGFTAGSYRDPSDTFTGFDQEIPIKGSTFGVDKVPTFKQTLPYPLTIASILTKTDLN